MCILPRTARQPALREALQIFGGIFWLLIATGLQSSVSGAGLAWNQHCGQLASGTPRDLCNKYYLASNALERVCAAHSWRELDRATFNCAGITYECLAAESLQSHNKPKVVELCKPLSEGATCSKGNNRCIVGVCMDVAGNAVDSNYLPTKPIPAPAVLGGSVTVKPLSPAAALSAVGNSGGSITNERGTVPADVIVVGIDTRVKGRQVPLGFLGPSLEWDAMGFYGRDPQVWAKMFTVLGPGHVIRLGGASQEQITKVPAEEEWAGMAALAKSSAQSRFIIGVPMGNNKPDVVKGMITKSHSSLGDALLGIELGNEPIYWRCPGLGGWTASGAFEPGYRPYLAYFDRMARQVTGCGSGASSRGDKIIMGPSWDNLNTFHVDYTDLFLSRSSCYLKEYTLHYYPYYKANAFNAQALLAESLMREAVRNVTIHVKKAAEYGQTLRISEANSLTSSGLTGTSGTFAAALWKADLSFELATAGVTGINFHWSYGGLPHNAGLPAKIAPYAGIGTVFLPNGKTAPRVRAPWYGYLLFQAAVQPKAAEAARLGGTTASRSSPGYLTPITAAAATPACQNGEIKVWPVIHDAKPDPIAQATQRRAQTSGAKELRVVVLHKGSERDCYVVLELTEKFADAKVTRVTPGGGVLTSDQVIFGGMSYRDLQPDISGSRWYDVVKASSGKGGGTVFRFNVPKASAALLVATSI